MAESQTMIRLCRKEAVCNLGSKLKKPYFREGAIKTRNNILLIPQRSRSLPGWVDGAGHDLSAPPQWSVQARAAG